MNLKYDGVRTRIRPIKRIAKIVFLLDSFMVLSQPPRHEMDDILRFFLSTLSLLLLPRISPQLQESILNRMDKSGNSSQEMEKLPTDTFAKFPRLSVGLCSCAYSILALICFAISIIEDWILSNDGLTTDLRTLKITVIFSGKRSLLSR